jgi:hypothetical protein
MKNSKLVMGLLALLLCSTMVNAATIPETPLVPTSSNLKARHRAQPTADAPIGVSLLARVAKPVVAINADTQAERVPITTDMPAGMRS